MVILEGTLAIFTSKNENQKDQRAGTLFDGNKSLKLVLPCKIESENNDNILQEFIAYKIYENISPYHFKTRRVNVDFNEIRGKKTKFSIKRFLIEDVKLVAKRHEGKSFLFCSSARYATYDINSKCPFSVSIRQ